MTDTDDLLAEAVVNARHLRILGFDETAKSIDLLRAEVKRLQAENETLRIAANSWAHVVKSHGTELSRVGDQMDLPSLPVSPDPTDTET